MWSSRICIFVAIFIAVIHRSSCQEVNVVTYMMTDGDRIEGFYANVTTIFRGVSRTAGVSYFIMLPAKCSTPFWEQSVSSFQLKTFINTADKLYGIGFCGHLAEPCSVKIDID